MGMKGVASFQGGSYVLSIGNTIGWQQSWAVIETFADTHAAAVFEGLQVKRLPKEIQGTAPRKLKQIDAAVWINLQAQYDLETTYRDMHKRIEAEVTPLALAG